MSNSAEPDQSIESSSITYIEYIKKTVDFIGDKFIMFISFDIENSTKHKHDDENGYITIVNRMMQIQASFEKLSEHFHLWKIIGDEVVFLRIYELTDIESNKKDIEIINNFVTKENTGEGLKFKATVWGTNILKKQIDDSKEDKEDINYYINEDTKVYLFLKAIYSFTVESRKELRDAILRQQNGDIITERFRWIIKFVVANLDFIGKAMDYGFRLSKFAKRGLLLISHCICVRLGLNNANIYIHEFRELKGIANNLPHPIIFYSSYISLEEFIKNNINALIENEDSFKKTIIDKEYKSFAETLNNLKPIYNYGGLC